ncbi:hypothetical protein Pelo_16366 [Pelomyxa schiedti]|nr:hypothetical protein Pelo_16366 [Pelomyxa schiedti]
MPGRSPLRPNPSHTPRFSLSHNLSFNLSLSLSLNLKLNLNLLSNCHRRMVNPSTDTTAAAAIASTSTSTTDASASTSTGTKGTSAGTGTSSTGLPLALPHGYTLPLFRRALGASYNVGTKKNQILQAVMDDETHKIPVSLPYEDRIKCASLVIQKLYLLYCLSSAKTPHQHKVLRSKLAICNQALETYMESSFDMDGLNARLGRTSTICGQEVTKNLYLAYQLNHLVSAAMNYNHIVLFDAEVKPFFLSERQLLLSDDVLYVFCGTYRRLKDIIFCTNVALVPSQIAGQFTRLKTLNLKNICLFLVQQSETCPSELVTALGTLACLSNAAVTCITGNAFLTCLTARRRMPHIRDVTIVDSTTPIHTPLPELATSFSPPQSQVFRSAMSAGIVDKFVDSVCEGCGSPIFTLTNDETGLPTNSS